MAIEKVQARLSELVAQQGPGLLWDRDWLEDLMKQAFPGEYEVEISALLLAAHLGEIGRLQESENKKVNEKFLDLISRELVEHGGLEEELARWAVDCWVKALGIEPGPWGLEPPDEDRVKLVSSREEFIAAADQPASRKIVKLAPGDYLLDEPLVLDQPLTVWGSQDGETRLLVSSGDAVLRLQEGQRWLFKDVHFIFQGSGGGDVVAVEDGYAVFERCYFTGGKLDRESMAGGDGLCYKNSSRGIAAGCETRDNDKSGITVMDEAFVMLKNNTCRGNNHAGIIFVGESGGIAQENQCQENGRAGISVISNSSPVLEKNRCSRNKEAGIVFFEEARGIVRDNHCFQNQTDGITVLEHSNPVLERNQCYENRETGIALLSRGGVLVQENRCYNNGWSGISVQEKARPVLEQNECRLNSEAGISYFDSSGGIALSNHCQENTASGIAVKENATPCLQENTCQQNREFGLAYYDKASGVARSNDFPGNSMGSIFLSGKASPLLEQNSAGTAKS